jgi:F-box-like
VNTVYLSRYTFEIVSQLDQEASTVAAAIREWRNSFLPINRFPPEVLALIPSHLPYQLDLIRLCSVCRYWRRTFINHAVLWSKFTLTLDVGAICITTWLQRARTSPLEIISTGTEGADTLALLRPYVRQFGSLSLLHHSWSDVQQFAIAASGPLPIMHNLRIHVTGFNPDDPEISSRPNCPLFSGAIHVRRFTLCAEGLPHLDHFPFSSLRTFQLSVTPEGTFADEREFPVRQLLDFLEATPVLEILTLEIYADISLDSVPQGRIVILPNVKRCHVTGKDPGFNIALHLSCPSADHTSVVCEHDADDNTIQDPLSTPIMWCRILPQYLPNQADALSLQSTAFNDVTCFLSFVSGSTTLQVGYKIIVDDDDDTPRPSMEAEYAEVFSQASRVIRTYPLLPNVRRLRIHDNNSPVSPQLLQHIINEVGQLFTSLGPLDHLMLETSDLLPYLAPFIHGPNGSDTLGSWFKYPQIFVLTIVNKSEQPLNGASEDGIVEFAKLQHALGIPFDKVNLQITTSNAQMAERLQRWVGSVHWK